MNSREFILEKEYFVREVGLALKLFNMYLPNL